MSEKIYSTITEKHEDKDDIWVKGNFPQNLKIAKLKNISLSDCIKSNLLYEF